MTALCAEAGFRTHTATARSPLLKVEAPMKRILFCLGFVMILDGSALAQSARKTPAFYVVLNSLTKSCSVVDRTPQTDTHNITVASDTIYKTHAEADAARKTLPSCNR